MVKSFNLVVLLFAMLVFSCSENQKPLTPEQAAIADQKAEVKEVIQATAYTYLRVMKSGGEQWIAISKGDVKVGDIVYYEPELEMTNFTSKELNRTFEKIYFVQHISSTPITKDNPGGLGATTPQKPILTKLDITVEQPEGGISVADLYKKRKEYSGKTVIVKGHVTKVNTGIMDRNWVHIQDGTADGENFDLTLTTKEEPSVGDVLTFSGKLATDKDFGSGYTYELIVEDAIQVK